MEQETGEEQSSPTGPSQAEQTLPLSCLAPFSVPPEEPSSPPPPEEVSQTEEPASTPDDWEKASIDAEEVPEECEARPVSHSELESALQEFRHWFEASLQRDGAPPPVADVPLIDVNTLLEHYLALRQEVNLQTRAVRSQQEQNTELLRLLQQSLEQLSQKQARSEQSEKLAVEEKLRPLLTSLVELYDNLYLAGREIMKALDTMTPLLEAARPKEEVCEPLPPVPALKPRSFWSRWVLSPTAEAILLSSQEETHAALVKLHNERERRQQIAEHARECCIRIEQGLQALVTGYTMSLERIERALQRHGLEVIPTVGETFDPEFMEVVEAVQGSGRPSGEVLEEVRRGYLHNGRIFRYAQVRVARS